MQDLGFRFLGLHGFQLLLMKHLWDEVWMVKRSNERSTSSQSGLRCKVAFILGSDA